MHIDLINLLLVTSDVGHFGKYQNTLCLTPQILNKHNLFLLSLGTIGNSAYAKFGDLGRQTKEYYGICQSGLWYFYLTNKD